MFAPGVSRFARQDASTKFVNIFLLTQKSSKMSDPLLALRDAIRSKSTITYSNSSGPCTSLSQATHLVLSPSVTLPKATPTRLRKPGGATSTDPQANPTDFVGLDAVYLAWSLRDKNGGDYLRLVRENGLVVGFVSVTERKALVDWLEGRLGQHDRIVPSACKLSTKITL